MALIEYVPKNFRESTLVIIDHANEIIADYATQGLCLTLRQLYYRFVASGLLQNMQREYNRLGAIVNDGRLAGLIDWEAIEDRGRSLNARPHWSDPAEIIRGSANGYAINKWEGQQYRVEVWVEKQALESVVLQACYPLDVDCFACKGYTSQSEMWRAAQRFQSYICNDNQTPVVIHLGDHDPSGIDMTRDIADRLVMFGVPMEVNRIALNMDQVEQYGPPPNPAKLSDSRATGYIEKFGESSWELDALEPATLNKLIQYHIGKYLDMKMFLRLKRKQEKERKMLLKVSANWEQVEKQFKGKKGKAG